MKAIVINADQKRKGTNAQIMKSAVDGAKSVGSEVEYVDLYKFDFSISSGRPVAPQSP